MPNKPKFTLGATRSGNWEIRWSEKGVGRTISKSQSTGTKDRAEAEVYLSHWVKARDQIAQQIAGVPNVETLARKYETQASRRRVGKTQAIVLKHLVGFFGKLKPTEIHDEDIADYCAFRKVSDSTLRRELNALVAVFNFAVRKRLISFADVPPIDLPPEGQRREVYLTEAEEKEFMAEITKADPKLALFCMIALRTGARKSAVETLSWDRVDLKGRFVDFRDPSISKTKKRRVPVPVDDVLFSLLDAAPRTSAQVIEGSVRKRLETWRKNNPKFAKVTPHVLRHTAATRWLRNGLSLWDVAGLLGDTVETTTRVYGHHSKQDLQKAMSGIAG
tara:strand:- start:9254 stop:10252 length:999 start_codon:yes stop_codon:yes gene_type:complete